MPVPEAAMHKNDNAVFGKNDVRFAGQGFHVKSETEACRMKCAPDKNFRLGVRAPDCSHHAASGGLVDNISQRL